MPVHLRTLAYGLGLAALDVVSFPLVKRVSTGWSMAWMAIPVLVYSMAPVVLLSALRTETLSVMNLLWDMLSDVLITAIGFFVFSERVAPLKAIGVCLSLVSVFLLTYENEAWNTRLLELFYGGVSIGKGAN